MTTRPAFAAGSAMVLLVAACAHSKDGSELSAQTGEDLSRSYGESAPLPPRETRSIGGGDAGDAPLVDTSDKPDLMNPSLTGGYVGPACPVACYVAEGRNKDPLAGEPLERMRAAVAPAMAGLRQCMSGGSSYRHHPIMNLRFNSAGDLTDVGVDTTGFEANIEDCMQQVVRGNVSNPVVKFEGPATVRCSETCARPTTPRAPRRR